MPDKRAKPRRESTSTGNERKSNFEFVSVVPTKDGRAKPTRQAVVRMNAARYQWRNSKAAKASARKAVVATVPVEGGPVDEHGEEDEGRKKQVTGSRYGLHGSRLALQTYYLSFADDENVAKIMTFSTFICS
jgi:hypothetical protein